MYLIWIADEPSAEPGRRNHVDAQGQQRDELRSGHREAPAGLARRGRTCNGPRRGPVLPGHPQRREPVQCAGGAGVQLPLPTICLW